VGRTPIRLAKPIAEMLDAFVILKGFIIGSCGSWAPISAKMRSRG
jgi:hypothetical protein